MGTESIPATMLYKYREFGQRTEEIITKSTLWFSKVKSLNDIFDTQLYYRQEYSREEIEKYWKCLPKYPKLKAKIDSEKLFDNDCFVKYQNKLQKKFIDPIGVLSFSVDPTNILMWSHYADSHKGLVFEFDSSLYKENKSKFFKATPYKVDYKNQYKPLSYVLAEAERKKQFQDLLLLKSLDWKYEQEYRMIDLENNGAKKFNKESLKSIIFGNAATQENIEKIKKLCSENGFEHVVFKWVDPVVGSFKLFVRGNN